MEKKSQLISEIKDLNKRTTIHPHAQRRIPPLPREEYMRSDRVGMALNGGGLEGFLYELGVLRALEDALGGRSLRSINVYSGQSCGSIAAAMMAGNFPLDEITKSLDGKSDFLPHGTAKMIFDIAGKSILKRVARQALNWSSYNPKRWVRGVANLIPTGIMKGDAFRQYMREVSEAFGQPDDFMHADAMNYLGPELYIGATDQDTFEHVTFGKPPYDKIPVSEAIRASCAVPPFFTPTQIDGRWFIDGQVSMTCDLNLLIERQCKLAIVIDPVKPHVTQTPGAIDLRGGIFATMQTFKAVLHTRFQSDLKSQVARHPEVDFLLFQPEGACAQLMSGSPIRTKMRTEIIPAAYCSTLRQLSGANYPVYRDKLGRFGFILKEQFDLRRLQANPII